jgi:dTDP-4-amino-4,6-dideoxygalactose transaminase
MIHIAKPLIGEEEKQAVLRVLNSGCIAQGPEVANFEKEFAGFCGAPFGVATTSGTTALDLALMSLGIGPGDEVITTPFSFFASASCINHVGATPVFCDIDPETYNMDADKIEELIRPKTMAILPVHLYGHPAEMDKIMAIADKYDLFVVEDACQAHGATYKGRKAGSIGDAAAFSFYPTKNMTTSEGGIALFSDEEVYERALMLRAHGMKERYHHELMGHNFRMTDIAAAIGREQLKKLPGFNAERQANAAYLSEHITNSSVVLPTHAPDCTHVYHQYTIRVQDRDQAIARLTEAEIGYGVHYPIDINEQPVYQELGYTGKDTPVADQASREVISLPVHPALTEADLEQIVAVVNSF